MKSFRAMRIIALNFILTSGCATLEQSPKISSNILAQNNVGASLISFNPNIPFPTDQAFFPMEKDLSGFFYSWRECEKKFVICLKWKLKKVSFKFDDREAMRFFKENDFGLVKRKGP
jgi:hypothetical protein